MLLGLLVVMVMIWSIDWSVECSTPECKKEVLLPNKNTCKKDDHRWGEHVTVLLQTLLSPDLHVGHPLQHHIDHPFHHGPRPWHTTHCLVPMKQNSDWSFTEYSIFQ